MRCFRIQTLFTWALLIALVPVASAQTLDIQFLDAEVGAGLSSSTSPRVNLSDGQHGGIFLTLTVDAPSVGLVAPDGASPGEDTIDIFVPNGTTSVLFRAQGVEGATGPVQITATAPGFSSDNETYQVVTPVLDMFSLMNPIDVPDPAALFFLQVGIPSGGGGISPREARVGATGVLITMDSDMPAVADFVKDATSGGNLTVLIDPGQERTWFSLPLGGIALRPLSAGTTTVTATAPGFTGLASTTELVTVNPTTLTLNPPVWPQVGAGLSSENRILSVNGSQHGGLTVRIESGDPSKLLVAPDAVTAGSAFVDFVIANGATTAQYHLHGLENQTGTVALTATATGVVGANVNIDVVAPSLDILDLTPSINTLDVSDPFQVRLGLPNPGGTLVIETRVLRPGGPGAVLTLTSNQASVGLIETLGGTSALETLNLSPGQGLTPFGIGAGGAGFDGVGPGMATVTASIPGFVSVDGSSQDVTVTSPGMSFVMESRIGGGQITVFNRVDLDSGNHGGVTVRVESDDPSLGLVSATSNDVGTTFVDVVVPDGSSQAQFYVHGIEGQVGTLGITATAPGFLTGNSSIDVVAPQLLINAPPTVQEVFDTPPNFFVSVGFQNIFNGFTSRDLRPGSAGVQVDVSLDNPAVAQIVTDSMSGSALSLTIPAGEGNTPTTLAAGGFAFDGLAPGTATLSFSAAAHTNFNADPVITVNQTAIAFSVFTGEVGAGLMSSLIGGTLGGPDHGGVTVRVESLDPSTMLVSPDHDTAGTAFFDVAVPDGQVSFLFVLHGVDGQAGLINFEASAPGFTTETNDIDVVQAGVQITNLGGTLSVGVDDEFYAAVGLMDGANASVIATQRRRAGEPPLPVTFASADGSIVELVTLSQNGNVVSGQIIPGASQTPLTLLGGGVAARPVGVGSTLVSATIPGFFPTGSATREVMVTSVGVATPGVPAAIGAGLQVGPLTAQLASTSHGGVTLNIASDDPTKLLVSNDPNTVGSASVNFVIPNGTDTAVYYLQAIEGTTGSVDVDLTAPGFQDGAISIQVSDPAIQLANLGASLNLGGANDPFQVQIGVANGDESALAQLQVVRPGGVAPSVNVVVDDIAFGLLETTGGTSGSVNFVIPAGEFETPATVGLGGVALQAVQVGTVTVTATGPGIDTEAAEQVVTINGATSAPIRHVLALNQNAPNPFNPSTVISFEVPARQHVRLNVYSVAGRLVRTLVDREMSAGFHDVKWAGRDQSGSSVASGTYFYVLDAGGHRFSRKMTLIK